MTVPIIGQAEREGAQPAQTRPRSPMRPDIQVLRAVAVLGVVIYHLWPGALPGGFIGVDVFFVISGFLVGGALAREVMATGRIRFAAFYARRVRRIAPLAGVVAIVTIIACAVLLSPLDLLLWGRAWGAPSTMRDAIAVALFVPNLWFGVSQVGYVNADVVSPFTHYWSLGVEEQFYLIAPLVLVVLWTATRRNRATFLLALGVLLAASLDYATIRESGAHFDGFFDPIGRVWELAVGALVATAGVGGRRWLERLRSPVTAGACLILILVSMATIGSTESWPRPAALIPVIATAGALWSGSATMRSRRWRGAAPWVWIGDRSYSIYLWHFPVIVLVPVALGRTMGGWEMLGSVYVVVVVSAVTYRWVELPFRRLPVSTPRNRRRLFLAGFGLSAVVVVAAVGVGVRASTGSLVSDRTAEHYAPHTLVGLNAPFQEYVPLNVRPAVGFASEDTPTNVRDGCNADPYMRKPGRRDCVFGSSGPTVVLYGDSHAAQWFDALAAGAYAGSYRLTPLTADGCLPMALDRDVVADECRAIRREALDAIARIKPDVLVVSARDTYTDLLSQKTPFEMYPHAIAAMLDGLSTDTHVVWIADGPTFASDLTRCAARTPDDIRGCASDPAAVLPSATNAAIRAVVEAHGGSFIDMAPYLCSQRTCGLIVDDVLLYRDDDHISATFSRALAPGLLAELRPFLDAARAGG